jgi:hypothetical protein
MHKYAAVTGLVIALNITMLTPAVSTSSLEFTGPYSKMPHLRSEGQCDSWANGLPLYAIHCHCRFECNRQYRYTVSVPCTPGQRGRDEGFCDRRVHPVESVHACMETCVKAKAAVQR